MRQSGPEISGSAVVITGASSGIGRAAAERFAAEGANLVLAARSPDDLDEVTARCQALGAEAFTVLTDVGDEAQIRDLAAAAVECFGRIDAWISNAGVIAYGHFEDMPSDVFDGVIRTNLLGQIYGARAALAQFRRQGSGVLVNLSSVWGRVTSPYVIPYVVSKHAVRAFSASLRQGIATTTGAERIHVCTVLPESVDTPIFRHAANYTGRPVKPVSPVIDVDRTAKAIVEAVREPRGEISVGRVGHAVAAGAALIPRPLYERIAPKLFEMAALDDGDAEYSPGNVLAPEPELNAVEGGWRNRSGSALARMAAGAAAVGAPLVAAGLIARRARHKG
ncbi:MAG TPA: SDR family NAD(P)-dependent oxidoreductase [Solirubrobacterales bacterium]|nr:SDR family NAD(P)-dependent oxidoreductase [Solirubrobacterales bacterium]